MSEKTLLAVRNLRVSVGEKEILHGVDLTVGKDETHVLMGPNGTGKSTLGYAITGNPAYIVTSGQILFKGEDITDLPVNERAKKGIFLSFQNPLEVPGVTLSSFIRSALEQKAGKRLRLWDFKKKLNETMKLLNMDESYAERDLNVGFSGGEKKKAEILQMLMLDSESRSDTVPAMDIRTRDAAVGHEAKIGSISGDAVFYLMSRGMSEEDARALIVSGFADNVSKELPLEYALEMNNLIRLEMKGSIG